MYLLSVFIRKSCRDPQLDLIYRFSHRRDFFKPESLKSALAELVGTFFLTLAALLGGTPYAVGLTLLKRMHE